MEWDSYAVFNNIVDEGTEEASFVSYELDMENNVAILYLDACSYNSEYIDCVQEMFAEVKAKNIENVAIDLRDNGGGSDLVISEFFKYLDIDSYKTATMGGRNSKWRVQRSNYT